MAAATVPEYKISPPRFGPLLIPEMTIVGLTGISSVIASFTPSLGVPVVDQAIFILPPSIDELRRRVVKRDGKVPTDLEVRMSNAEMEISRAHEFNFRLVNDEFDSSYAQFKKIVAELL